MNVSQPEPNAMSGRLARRIVDRFAETVKERGKLMAQQWGAPFDGEPLSREQTLRLWNVRNVDADPMQVQQLLAAGQTQQALDLVYPWRSKLVGRGGLQARIDRATSLAQAAREYALAQQEAALSPSPPLASPAPAVPPQEAPLP